MPITGERLSEWIRETSRLSVSFTSSFEARFGYPPGENAVVALPTRDVEAVAQALKAAGVRGDLLDLYRQVEVVSLPDVGIGLFVHAAGNVIEGMTAGVHPTRIIGSVSDEVTVFGSDGGGALFALSASQDKVYKLHGGSLVGSIYQVDDSNAEIVARGLWEFLEYLRGELSQAVSPD